MVVRAWWLVLVVGLLACSSGEDSGDADAALAGAGGTSVLDASSGAGGSAAHSGSGGSSGVGGNVDSGGFGDAGGTGGQDSGMESEVCPPPPDDLPTDITATTETFNERHITLSGFKHPALDQPVTVQLYLPLSYSSSESYPVLYAHDGQNFAAQLSDVIESEIENGRSLEAHIVVGIESHGNAIDMKSRVVFLSPSPHTAPIPDEASGTIQQGEGGKGLYVDELLVNVIKPYIDSHYATRCGRSNTTIFGYSIGGLMCLYHLMQHPDVFGRGHCMSSSFWYNEEEWVEAWRNYTGPNPVRLWLDVGGSEPFDLMRSPARKVRDIGLARGMTMGRDMGYYELPDADHAQGVIRVPDFPWVLWSISNNDLPGDSATDIALLIEPTPPASPFAFADEGECAINIAYPDDYMLTWPNGDAELTSSDPAIATVDETGHVSSVSMGTAYIQAAANNSVASSIWMSP